MRYSIVIIPLLLLTLVPRLMAQDRVKGPDASRFYDDAAAALNNAGFATQLQSRNAYSLISANRGDCTLMMSADFNIGTDPSAFLTIQPEGRAVRYFNRGEWLNAMPRFRPTLDFYAQRHLASVGVEYSYSPVALVSADSSCDLGWLSAASLRVYPESDGPR